MITKRWLVGALAFLLAGCGAEKDQSAADGAQGRMKRAAERFAGVDDVRMVGSMDSELQGDRFVMRGDFVMTSDAQSMTMDGTLKQGGRDIRLEMINVGDDYYYSGKHFGPLLEPGQRWVHETAGGGTLSFAQFFDLLGATESMRLVGEEAVRGRPTDHFEGSVDVDAIAQAFGVAAPEKFEDGTAAEDFQLDLGVWLDADDDLRRMEIHASIAGTPQRLDGRFDIVEFDTGRRIAPPPAAQVAELDG